MRKVFYLVLAFWVNACSTTPSRIKKEDTSLINTDTPAGMNAVSKDSLSSGFDNEYANYFIVIADTSLNYYSLDDKMFGLSNRLGISIDSMGRFYNRRKNLISLPENDRDELYAGQYFPRRFPSESMSLEYLKFYEAGAGEKTIALVTGIYESEKSAETALANLREIEKNGFKIKARIYTGCIH